MIKHHTLRKIRRNHKQKKSNKVTVVSQMSNCQSTEENMPNPVEFASMAEMGQL